MSLRIEQLKQFIEEDQTDLFLKYALALEYGKLGNVKEAVDLLNRIIDEDQDYLAAYYQLGKLHEKQNEKALAANIYQQGMKIAKAAANQKTFMELKEAYNWLMDDE